MKNKTKKELLKENEDLKLYAEYLRGSLETAKSITNYISETKPITKKSQGLEFFIWCILVILVITQLIIIFI